MNEPAWFIGIQFRTNLIVLAYVDMTELWQLSYWEDKSWNGAYSDLILEPLLILLSSDHEKHRLAHWQNQENYKRGRKISFKIKSCSIELFALKDFLSWQAKINKPFWYCN